MRAIPGQSDVNAPGLEPRARGPTSSAATARVPGPLRDPPQSLSHTSIGGGSHFFRYPEHPRAAARRLPRSVRPEPPWPDPGCRGRGTRAVSHPAGAPRPRRGRAPHPLSPSGMRRPPSRSLGAAIPARFAAAAEASAPRRSSRRGCHGACASAPCTPDPGPRRASPAEAGAVHASCRRALREASREASGSVSGRVPLLLCARAFRASRPGKRSARLACARVPQVSLMRAFRGPC